MIANQCQDCQPCGDDLICCMLASNHCCIQWFCRQEARLMMQYSLDLCCLEDMSSITEPYDASSPSSHSEQTARSPAACHATPAPFLMDNTEIREELQLLLFCESHGPQPSNYIDAHAFLTHEYRAFLVQSIKSVSYPGLKHNLGGAMLFSDALSWTSNSAACQTLAILCCTILIRNAFTFAKLSRLQCCRIGHRMS